MKLSEQWDKSTVDSQTQESMSVAGVSINKSIVVKIDWPLVISLIWIIVGILVLTVLLLYIINYFLWTPKKI